MSSNATPPATDDPTPSADRWPADSPASGVPSPEPDGSPPAFETDATAPGVADTNTSVLVAMPAYNEGGTVGGVVTAVAPYADSVLVVDDGSRDDTALEADRAGAHVVHHSTNRGYGGALKTIFREAAARNADHLVVIDADGQHNPGDIPRLVAAQIETGANVVIGSRFTTGAATDAPLYRRFGLWVINGLTNLSLGAYRAADRLSDAQSGFRAYDTRATRSLAADETIGDCMAASLDILYHVHRNGYTTAEVGTTITYDVEHASTQNPITQGFDLVSAIFVTTVRDRPLFALGAPGVVVLLFGLLVPLFLLAPIASVALLGAFSLLSLCGVGLCGVGLHRHLSTREVSDSTTVTAEARTARSLSED